MVTRMPAVIVQDLEKAEKEQESGNFDEAVRL